MPDPRADWGQGGWNDCGVVWLFANTNSDQSPAHGWYAIFVWWDRGYILNRNIKFKGEGNSVHKNVFIAKVAYQGKDKRRNTAYVDIPKEFIEQDVLNAVTGTHPTTGGFAIVALDGRVSGRS